MLFAVRPLPDFNLHERHEVPCRTACPLDSNATVSWCIHLLTIKYEVRMCWNGSGELHMSPAARLIRVENQGLENFLAVDNTTFKISQTPILLKHALLGCFVQSGSCDSTQYYSIDIGSKSSYV